MKRPFNIFPSIGYKNSQFQIISTVDNLKVEIYDQEEVVKAIEVNSNNPSLLTRLDRTGRLVAKCVVGDEEFEQELEIKEAFRLGSSEFKKAFVFDDTDYSFFLMKDRLLLYDERKKVLLTENHYSPTEIHKINESNFLFVTKVGNHRSGIVNLGIYSTETFSIVGELLNDYREIKIIPNSNKAWLYNKKNETIHCFELENQSSNYLTEVKFYENFNNFFLDESERNIFISYGSVVRCSDLINLHKSFEISKKTNNAIDKLGNVFTLENRVLKCTNLPTNTIETLNIDFEFSLQDENFLHLGKDLKTEVELLDLNTRAEEIKKEMISLLPKNQTYYYHDLTESQKISESYLTHKVYLTENGVFILQKKTIRDFKAITFKKQHVDYHWNTTPKTLEKTEFTLLFSKSGKIEILIDKTPNLIIEEYQSEMLVVNYQNTKELYSGRNKITIDREAQVELFTVNDINYFLIKSNERYSLYNSTDLRQAILEQIEILNANQYENHKIIWYRGNEKYVSSKKYLNAFDLKNCANMPFYEKSINNTLFNDAVDFNFFEKYGLSSNQVVFNPETLEIKDAFIGVIVSHSRNLNKIISHRTSNIYLSKFNVKIGKYELSEIALDDKKYKESYLSPNGQFLVLQDDSNKYSFYDIDKGETINFISGNFLAFRNDGSLIIEEDSRRAVKIIDPKTFQDITPPNYHHYRFMSPDGKLYAQVSSKVRYSHKLNGKELKVQEVAQLRKDLDQSLQFPSLSEFMKEKAKIQLDKNRKEIFDLFKKQFIQLGINDHDNIRSHSVIRVETFTEIGITGTNIKTEVLFPEDIWFYNYFAFSYDNKYCGWVGKPSGRSGGYIGLMKIDVNVNLNFISIEDSYLSNYPRMASWVCGFSKTGFFATYDSTPDTYLINIEDDLFVSKTTEIDLQRNLNKNKSNIYNKYQMWNEIKGKNFLCFSPTGRYLALSEQGYEPLTLGGYGHQESNVVHLAKTESGEILDSFIGHGDKIKDDINKKVTFVAFSENERKLMTLSSDGVVIIRDINLREMV